MALMQWEPLNELGAIQTEMNRLFNTVFEASPPGDGGGRWTPAMDLLETEDDFVLRADLPGLSEDDVTIELQAGTLTISGERKPEHEGGPAEYRRLERGWGSFSRSLAVPERIDPESIAARVDRGILEVRIPKPEQHKPHRVTIAVGGEQRREVEA